MKCFVKILILLGAIGFTGCYDEHLTNIDPEITIEQSYVLPIGSSAIPFIDIIEVDSSALKNSQFEVTLPPSTALQMKDYWMNVDFNKALEIDSIKECTVRVIISSKIVLPLFVQVSFYDADYNLLDLNVNNTGCDKFQNIPQCKGIAINKEEVILEFEFDAQDVGQLLNAKNCLIKSWLNNTDDRIRKLTIYKESKFHVNLGTVIHGMIYSN